jgi:hypothetical protein
MKLFNVDIVVAAEGTKFVQLLNFLGRLKYPATRVLAAEKLVSL